MRPDSVNILGIPYQIQYVDKPSDVDIRGRESLWGQIDYWTRSIRIYAAGLCDEDVWDSIFEEVLHGIAERLKLKELSKDDNHDELSLLALAITDVLFRNDWIKR